jgi:hypothetical protein
VGLPLKEIEVGGTIDAQRRLQLDEPLPIVGPIRRPVGNQSAACSMFDRADWAAPDLRVVTYRHTALSSAVTCLQKA